MEADAPPDDDVADMTSEASVPSAGSSLDEDEEEELLVTAKSSVPRGRFVVASIAVTGGRRESNKGRPTWRRGDAAVDTWVSSSADSPSRMSASSLVARVDLTVRVAARTCLSLMPEEEDDAESVGDGALLVAAFSSSRLLLLGAEAIAAGIQTFFELRHRRLTGIEAGNIFSSQKSKDSRK